MYNISKEKQYEINQFLTKNITFYPEDLQSLIKERLYDGESIIDILMQIYSYKDAVLRELNPYYQFAELIKEKFEGLEDKRITEVGCGFLPALSLALNNTVNRRGLIDVYDPNLININYPQINNHPESFTNNSNHATDLYIANMPCDATEILIDTAISQKKELALQT